MTNISPTYKTHALLKAFTEHPASVNESYFEHMFFAFRFALRLFRAGLAALIHALIPALCETTASKQIEAMHADIVRRRADPSVG